MEEHWVAAKAEIDPLELSRREEERWIAAKAIVDMRAVQDARKREVTVPNEENSESGLIDQAFEQAREKTFEIPDVQSIVDTVLKRHSQADYIHVA